MNDERPDRSDLPETDSAIDPGEVASAGRSCLVLIILGIAVVLVLCVGIAARWAMTS